MRITRSGSSATATINMTPMIDIVFLLIIFFLVSSQMAQNENRVQLNLPVAGSGDNDDRRESVVVNILEDGRWQSGGVVVNEAELTNVIRRRSMAATEAVQLRIRMDRDVAYDRIEPVLAIANKLGIGDIAFSVFEDKR
jgi:biopolymer transport protein ExbD